MKKRKLICLLELILGATLITSCSCSNNSSNETSTNDVKGTFTLYLNPCGGNLSTKTYTGTSGTTIELKNIKPGLANYAFIGWSTVYSSKTKMGDSSKIISDNKFTFTDNNAVLYACYSEPNAGSHTQEEIDAYMAQLQETSETNHLYIHYYRYLNNADDYNDWDVWCWPYRPNEGQGARFDWKGRTQSTDHLSASGNPVIDDFGGVTADIDLTKDYDGGTSNQGHSIGGTNVSFYTDENKTNLDTQVGIQIVYSSARTTSTGSFWKNDGGNVYLSLNDEETVSSLTTSDGGKSYHVFVIQDKVGKPQPLPITGAVDPYKNDDGTNTTDKEKYQNADWDDKEKMPTSNEWLNNVGVGYQIMVASFADSDGDGFGDIYGITQKLDYLNQLGVKAIWLTPIQLSDSYHGYDISDYTQVDPKFGSKVSPNAENGVVTSASAMEDYKDLITKAHEKGIKVVMDLVLNHTSTSNNWFASSASLEEEYRGFYQWGNHETDDKINENNSWYPYGDHDYSYYAKFGSSMPELNYSYQGTREAVEQMSLKWCSIGVDGFRLDAVKHIYMLDELGVDYSEDTTINDVSSSGDYSSDLTKNLNFFRELNYVVKKSYPNAFFVGENFDGHAFHVAPYYESFDSMFDFYTYFKLTNLAASSYANNGYNQAGSFMQSGSKWSSSSESSISNGSKEYKEIDGKYGWNLPDLYKAYDTYRGDKAMPGSFTSNHDIARTINRIAGSFDEKTKEISKQGNVTLANYDALNKKATIAKIATILLPGCSWVYYGDELGMTGNFEKEKDSTSDYADLAYRQPMKWKQDGQVNDGSFTTGYNITGSEASVEWDDINKSNAVKDAETQANDSNSIFAKIKQAIAFKNTNSALINGTFSDDGSTGYVLKWKIEKGDKTYHISIDFNNAIVNVTGSDTLTIEC
jgi:glycosidase